MLPLINASPSPVNDSLRAKSKQTGRFGYKIVLFLWFLFLFEPARLIAYYIPGVEPLKWLPTILLIAASFHWLTSPLKKHNYKWFTYFLIVNLDRSVTL